MKSNSGLWNLLAVLLLIGATAYFMPDILTAIQKGAYEGAKEGAEAGAKAAVKEAIDKATPSWLK